MFLCLFCTCMYSHHLICTSVQITSNCVQGGVPRVADFVHGEDGLGNTYQAKPKGQKLDISAADFLTEKVAEFSGEVTVVALGPLTNIALVSSLAFTTVSVFKCYLDFQYKSCNLEC